MASSVLSDQTGLLVEITIQKNLACFGLIGKNRLLVALIINGRRQEA